MGTKTFEIAHQGVTTLSFKPDSAYFVAADRSGSIRQWSANNAVQDSLWIMDTKRQVNAVVVSPDGQWVISCETVNTVAIWNTMTREREREVAEHTASILALDVSNDSMRFASGSADSTVRIFDIASGIRLLAPLQQSYAVTSVKFSPDASKIAIGGQYYVYVRVYDARSGDHLFDARDQDNGYRVTSTVSWSLDGQRLFADSPGKITCLELSAHHPGYSRSEWPTHDSNGRVSIVTSGKFIAYSVGSSVSFWDPASREQIGQTINHATGVSCIAISHDGRYLACGHGGGITIHGLEGFIPEHYLPGILCLPLMRLSATVLKSWVQGNPTKAEVTLSDEIAQHSNPTHDAFAIRALIRAHLGEWRTALEDAEMSLKIKQSPIGQIARSIALVGVGEQEVALNNLDWVLCDCDPADNKLLLVINSILLFVCKKRELAISRLRHFISVSDEKIKDMSLQVLGMMYLKLGDHQNAVETLGLIKNPFTTEDRGSLMTIFIIFNWNFENLKFVAWQRACERLYTCGSMKEVQDTLLRMVATLPEDEREVTHCRILQEIITRSGEVTLLAWTGKSSMCNSCLPNSPATYAHTSAVLQSLALEGEELQKRTTELRTIFPLMDALMTYCSVTRSQPVRFPRFHLLLPCIVFRVKTLRKEHEKVYHAETVGLGDVEFTTADSIVLKDSRKFVFVNPWIHHFRESRSDVAWRDEDSEGSDVELNARAGSSADPDPDLELVHEPIIEEVPTSPTSGEEEDVHTRALQLIAHLGQPFSALMLLRQPDGAYKRVAADYEIAVRGVHDDVLKDLRVEVLEIL